MRKNPIMQCLAAVLLCVALVTPCLVHGARAAEPELCSLQLTYAPDDQPMTEVTFHAYRVADIDMERVRYHITEKYADYNNVLNDSGTWLDRAATLSAYLSRDQVEADVEGMTDKNGRLSFTELESGLYLITGASTYRGGYRYTPVPFLLCLPYTEDGYSWDYHTQANVKYTYSFTGTGDRTVQRRAIKVWNDNGFEEERPQEVVVQLLQDGVVYATATLNADNNWRCDWTELPADSDWQLAEISPGGNYTVSVTQNGVTFVVTNTYHEDITIVDEDPPLSDGGDEIDIIDEDPPLADLPQTGVLWWPVAPLAMLGAVLLCVGCIQRRKGANYEEE